MRTTRSETLGSLPVQFDTSARDFASMRNALLRFLQDKTPQWTDLDPADPGVMLLEAVAYVSDVLNYSIDRAQNEAYLSTAQELSNVINILDLIGYTMSTGAGASVPLVAICTVANTTIPAGTTLTSGSHTFEIINDILLPNVGIYAPTSVSSIVQDQLGDFVIPNEQLIAYYGTTVYETVGISTGEPNQSFVLRQPFVSLTSASSINILVGSVAYTLSNNFLDTESDTPVFTYSTKSDGFVTIKFGDGINGLIPAINAEIIATYRVGVGSGANSISVNALRSTAVPNVTIYNPISPSGGKDAETIQEARENAPLTMRALDRAVTLQDFEILATRAPFGGVRACKATSTDPYDVIVYICAAGSNPIPSGYWYPQIDAGTGLIGAVGRWLQSKSTVGVSVDVRAPDPVKINISATVKCSPNILRDSVQRALSNAMLQLLLDSSAMFGVMIPVSKIIQVIENTQGVDYVNIEKMHRQPALLSIKGPKDRALTANLNITDIDPKCSANRYTIEWIDASRYKLKVSDYGYIRPSYRSTRPSIFIAGETYSVYLYPSVDTDDTAERDRQFNIQVLTGIFPQRGDVWGFRTDFYVGNIDLDPNEIVVPTLVNNVIDPAYINLKLVGGI